MKIVFLYEKPKCPRTKFCRTLKNLGKLIKEKEFTNLSNNLTKVDHKKMSNLILDQANILDGNILSNPSGYLENLTEIFIK